MDLAFIKDSNWFRIRACAVIVRDNKILMCKNTVDDYYYSVGGAVEHGEKIEDAVVREVFEETGARLSIDRLLFIHQNYFMGDFSRCGKGELNCHEIAFYFLMQDTGEQLVSSNLLFDGKTETTVWLAMDDFKVKKVYPKWLPEMLNNKEVKMITSDYDD